MKTTVNLPDPLLAEVKKVAAEEGLTFKDLLISGLRRELDTRRQRAGAEPYRYQRRTFRGGGLRDGLRLEDWSRIRELAYDDRGG